MLTLYALYVGNRCTKLYINFPQALELTLLQSHLTEKNVAVAIHTVFISVPPGTHYCCMDRGGVDSKLA